jgi:GNAT superfamily N-acetyltransferase
MRFEEAYYLEKEHWLGGVFVSAEYRSKGIALRLVDRALERARSLGVKVLHLQTEKMDGGLYAKLGWNPLEQVYYKGQEVLVMGRAIDA